MSPTVLMPRLSSFSPFFFFNDTATTEIYTLSLHDALPISKSPVICTDVLLGESSSVPLTYTRSEEHTSELQSQSNLVCRLLLEKKNMMAAGRGIMRRLATSSPGSTSSN